MYIKCTKVLNLYSVCGFRKVVEKQTGEMNGVALDFAAAAAAAWMRFSSC